MFVFFVYRQSKYTTIRSAKELQAGDHVSWPTEAMSGMFQHHAIVVAHKGENHFRIIHVIQEGESSISGSAFSRSKSSKSSKSSSTSSDSSPSVRQVVETQCDLSEKISKKDVRRYDHDPHHCYEPAEVIVRARSMMGLYDYHVLENNCEHFARWCKTGKKVANQGRVAKKIPPLNKVAGSV